ncbi:MAG: hypothetical protein HQL23_07100, partial [Candidatus Omnitrophica bacterium]|nr:hypothetical protein [Candidatus Omnitrophota bacterium]
MAIILFANRGDRNIRIIFAALCAFVSFWGLGGCFFSATLNLTQVYFWWQIAYIGVIFAPVLYAHFVFAYLKINRKKLLYLAYVFTIFCLFCVFWKKGSFLGDFRLLKDSYYYLDWQSYRSPLYLFFYIACYWILVLYAFSLLLIRYFSLRGFEKLQLKYLILGSSIGWIGPHGHFLNIFGYYFYPPIFNLFIAAYPVIITYSIVKYRLLDIRVAMSRVAIFIFVYALVLGLPFYVHLLGFKFQALIMGIGLASAGPFIYNIIQRRAEAKILEEERYYQKTVRALA